MLLSLSRAPWLPLVCGFAALLLTACNDDSSSSDSANTGYGYVQFYNASANSSTTRFLADGDLLSTATFGDATARFSLTPEEYRLTVERLDPDDASSTFEIVEQTLDLDEDYYHFYALVGDYSSPELVHYRYQPETDFDEDADQFELMAFNLSSEYPQLEIYYAEDDGGQDASTFLMALGSQGQSDFVALDEGTYRFYVADAETGALILSTEQVSFSEDASYFMVVRDHDAGVSLDQITASTFVYNYPNVEANAELRVYHSVDDLGNVDLLLDGTRGEYSIQGLSLDQQSDFLTVPYGDYTATLTEAGNADRVYLQNKLVSLNAGDSRNLLIYRNSSDALSTLVFDQDRRERLYEHDINFISLANIRDEDDDLYLLKIYFVNEAQGETFETASQVLTGVDFAKVRNFTLVNGDYAVYASYTDGDGELQLAAEMLKVSLQANTNYQILLEPDDNTYTGYRLTLLE